MKITGNDETIKYLSDSSVKRTEDQGQRTHSGTSAQGTADDTVVNLSQRSKDIQLAEKAMNSEPDIRFDKVEDVSKKIENGSYKMDHGKTGEKMLAMFIDEMA